MELLAILIALCVVVFGGAGFKRSLKESPTVAFIDQAPRRFGYPRIIAFGVIAVAAVSYLAG